MLNRHNLRHCVKVARYMYAHADEVFEHPSEEQRRDMWLVGLLHDIGREFSKQDGNYHGDVAADMLERCRYPYAGVIRMHGIKYGEDSKVLRLLNKADWHIDSRGEYVSLRERLYNIRKHHGEDSPAYKNAKQMYYRIKEDERRHA